MRKIIEYSVIAVFLYVLITLFPNKVWWFYPFAGGLFGLLEVLANKACSGLAGMLAKKRTGSKPANR